MNAGLGTFTTTPRRAAARGGPPGRPGTAASPARPRGPRAGLPPFGFRVEGPDDWPAVRLGARSAAEVEAAAASQLGWTDLDEAERATAHRMLGGLAAEAHRAGVAVVMFRVGRDGSGRLFAGSLSFSWLDSDPVPADTTLVRRVVGWTTPQQRVDTATGPAVLTRETLAAPAGWRALFADDAAATAQAFLPVPHTSWTCVATAVVAGAEHADLAASLARRGAETLRVLAPADPGPARHRPGPAGPDARQPDRTDPTDSHTRPTPTTGTTHTRRT